MVEKRPFNITIFGARINPCPKPDEDELQIDSHQTILNFSARSVADAYAKKWATTKFPPAEKWRPLFSVVEMAQGSVSVEPGFMSVEYDTVKDYLDKVISSIRANIVWNKILELEHAKQFQAKLDFILDVLKKHGNPISDKQMVIPKDRAIYWERIKIHIASYLESEEKFSKEVGA